MSDVLLLQTSILPVTWDEILNDQQVLEGSITGWTAGQGMIRGPLSEIHEYRGVITITSAWTASYHERTEPQFRNWYRRAGTTWSIAKNSHHPWRHAADLGFICFPLPQYSMCFLTLRDHGGAEHLDVSKLHELPAVAA